MIRLAKNEESLVIAKLLRDYSYSIDIDCGKEAFSLRKTANFVSSCVSQKLCWVYEKEGEILGCACAIEQFNIYSDTQKELHLVTLYVDSQHRGLAGGRLIKAFDKEANNRGVSVRWIKLQHTAEIKSLEKIGYKISELTYKKEN